MTGISADGFTLPAAMLLAGLLGSGHCLAMCGGIAGALGATARDRPAWQRALLFNGGRVLGYGLLGLLAGVLSAGLGLLTGLTWLRLTAGALLVILGLQLLTGWPLLAPLERLGGRLWQRIAPQISRRLATPSASRMLGIGMLWALLPCGLVYTALAAALTGGGPLTGAATMLAFGLGTLPAMAGVTLGGGIVLRGLRSRNGRRLAGALILAGGLWTCWAALPAGDHHGHAGHAQHIMQRPGR